MPIRPRGGFAPETFFFSAAVPNKGRQYKVVFEAHLTGITDASSPEWGSFKEMGRADPVVMYGGVNRSVTIAFLIVATDFNEHLDNRDRMRQLGNMTYPIYEAGKGYNGIHTFFKVGRHMAGYGVITSLDYNWQGEYPWIDDQPLLTEATVNLKVLANKDGKRPEFKTDGSFDYLGGE